MVHLLQLPKGMNNPLKSIQNRAHTLRHWLTIFVGLSMLITFFSIDVMAVTWQNGPKSSRNQGHNSDSNSRSKANWRNFFGGNGAEPNEGNQREIDVAGRSGLVGNGGGGGFACFSSATEFAEAKSNPRIWFSSPENLAKPFDVYSLDYIEYVNENPGGVWITAQEGETAYSYLVRVITKGVSPLLPLFGDHLLRALREIHPDTWKDSTYLELIHDQGAAAESRSYNNCVRIQLAERKKAEQTKACHFPVIEMTAAKHLIRKMQTVAEDPTRGIYNEASLLLHEALYLMGTELGQRTSENTRRLVGKILDRRSYSMGYSLGAEVAAHQLAKNIFEDNFANYYELFFAPSCYVNPVRKELQTAFVSLKQKELEFIADNNLDSDVASDRTLFSWAVRYGLPDIFVNGLTPAEAFLAAAPFITSLYPENLFHQEELLVPSRSGIFSEYCRLLEENLNRLDSQLEFSKTPASRSGILGLIPVNQRDLEQTFLDKIKIMKNAINFCPDVLQPNALESFNKIVE